MTQHTTFQDTSRRVAVFVDGDNIQADFAQTVLHHAKQFGRVDIARVYTDQNHASNWQGTTGYRQFNSGAGKNATDLHLSIDATRVALSKDVQSVVIATCDQDFSYLAQTLREAGIFVSGVGKDNASAAFRNACHSFKTLSSPKKASSATELDKQIRAVIHEFGKPGKGIRIADLNGPMRRIHEVKISALEEKNWHKYLSNRHELYSVDQRGPEASVRIKEKGF